MKKYIKSLSCVLLGANLLLPLSVFASKTTDYIYMYGTEGGVSNILGQDSSGNWIYDYAVDSGISSPNLYAVCKGADGFVYGEGNTRGPKEYYNLSTQQQFMYEASLFKNNVEITDHTTVAAGDILRVSPVWNDNNIQWFFTGSLTDSPVGHWVNGAGYAGVDTYLGLGNANYTESYLMNYLNSAQSYTGQLMIYAAQYNVDTSGLMPAQILTQIIIRSGGAVSTSTVLSAAQKTAKTISASTVITQVGGYDYNTVEGTLMNTISFHAWRDLGIDPTGKTIQQIIDLDHSTSAAGLCSKFSSGGTTGWNYPPASITPVYFGLSIAPPTPTYTFTGPCTQIGNTGSCTVTGLGTITAKINFPASNYSMYSNACLGQNTNTVLLCQAGSTSPKSISFTVGDAPNINLYFSVLEKIKRFKTDRESIFSYLKNVLVDDAFAGK